MTIKLFSTVPSNKDYMWQIVLIPTISILRNKEDEMYTVINLEWLFWNVSIMMYDEISVY